MSKKQVKHLKDFLFNVNQRISKRIFIQFIKPQEKNKKLLEYS